MSLKTVQVRLTQEQVEYIAKMVKGPLYESVSEAIRSIVKKDMNANKKEMEGLKNGCF